MDAVSADPRPAGEPVLAGDAPTASFLIPCHNLGRFLDEAVDSVFAQTRQDFEVLIVDDGSTDPATRELLAGYRRPRTRVLRIENRGLAGARNFLIRKARGTYVCTLDADDLLEPAYLERSIAALEADPGLAFASHWLRAFGDEEWNWTPERCDFPILLDHNTVNGAALVRREALLAAGLFDETMTRGCEDWDLWITMVERGHRGTILPEFLFRYRRRAGSMSRIMNAGPQSVEIFEYLVRKHEASYRKHLDALFLRREGEVADHRAHAYELEREQERWLAPALSRLREEVGPLRRKEALVRAEAERQAEAARVQAELGAERERSAGLDAGLQDVRRQAEDYRRQAEELLRQAGELQRQAGELQRQAGELQRQAGELRASMSWRLTAPLRALHRLLSGSGGGGI